MVMPSAETPQPLEAQNKPSSNMFPYEKLEERQIRLIAFMNTSGLNCKLITHTLTPDLAYSALSYTWGNSSAQHLHSSDTGYQITLNDHAVPVQQNLHDALRHLAPLALRRTSSGYLWIDYLCINQSDLAERASQVRLMTRLYTQAHTVLAWLGLPAYPNEARAAKDLLSDLDGYISESFRADPGRTIDDVWADIASSSFPPPPPSSSVTPACFVPHPNLPDVVAAWDGLAEMLTKPYWRRTWVYQEATAPTKILFCCGEQVFDERELEAGILFGTAFAESSSTFPAHLARAVGSEGYAARLVSARKARERGQGLELMALMRRMRTTRCGDDRDKVFASLGVAADVEGEGGEEGTFRPSVDYGRSLGMVYVDVMRYAFERVGLAALDEIIVPTPDASHPALQKIRQPALPSWVVDWRVEIGKTGFNPDAGRRGKVELYHACRGADDTGAVRRIEDDTVLVISGSVIDQVSMVTSIWDDDAYSPEVVKRWRELLMADNPQLDDRTFDKLLMADAERSEDYDDMSYSRGGAFDWQLLESPLELNAIQQRHKTFMTTRMQNVCRARRAGLTSQRRAAMFPAATQKGDVVVALYGGRCLYVLRHSEDRVGSWMFIGSCYVDGMMDGQAINRDEPRWRNIFRIV